MEEDELHEIREHFNSITSEDDLGDVLFGENSSFDDVRAKINALDDEGQE